MPGPFYTLPRSKRVLAVNVPSPWDIVAKARRGNEIADEERRAAGPRAHNDSRDALRHATWAKRSAEAVGPNFTWLVGLGHEVENLLIDRQPFAESLMDLHNNRVGLRAAQANRVIDSKRLQSRPISARATALRAVTGTLYDPRPTRTMNDDDAEKAYPPRRYLRFGR